MWRWWRWRTSFRGRRRSGRTGMRCRVRLRTTGSCWRSTRSRGSVPARTTGRTHTPPPGAWRWDPAKLDVEEFGSAFVRFSNGSAMVFKISWAVHLESLGKSYFLGPKGGMQIDPLEIYRDEFGTMVNITPKLPDDRVDRFKEEMQAFTDAIREDRPAPIPAEEVVWTNVIMDGIYRSAAEGREVAVALPG